MNKRLSCVLFWFGAGLVVLAVGMFAWSRISVTLCRSRAEETAQTLLSLMPEVQKGVPDGRTRTEMPVLELDGADFAGVLEIPAYDVCLPFCNAWSASGVQKYPHRFAGSMYDGTLVIGGSDNGGQLDCIDVISIGDTVYVTDVTGEQYAYTVTWVEKTKDVSAERLCDGQYDLTLFARNTYGFEYTVVRLNEGI